MHRPLPGHISGPVHPRLWSCAAKLSFKRGSVYQQCLLLLGGATDTMLGTDCHAGRWVQQLLVWGLLPGLALVAGCVGGLAVCWYD